MQFLLQIIVIGLKFIIPTLLLWFPFPAAWGNYFLDVVDGDILLHLGIPEYTYQTIDKAADYFSYIIMAIVGWRWRIRWLILALFFYRTIGQVLFFLTRDEMVFFYFQNLLEPLVMAYTLFLFMNKGSESKAYASYRKHIVLTWLIIISYKLWNEWYLHFANIDLSLLFLGVTGGQ